MQKRPRIAGAFVLPLFTSAGVALVVESLFLEEFDHRLADVGDGIRDGDACCVEGCNLVRCCALAAGDDRACMTHALARRRLTAGNERRDRLILQILLDPLCGFLLCRAADLTDDEDGVGVGVVLEELERIDEVCALDGVAADADGGRLTDARIRELECRLIGEGSGARDESDVAGLADRAGRDAELGLLGGEKTGAVRPDEAGLLTLHVAAYLHHVEYGDVLGDADDEVEIRIDRLKDGVRREACGDVDDGGGCTRRLHSVCNGIEYGHALDGLPRLAGGDAADDLCAVVEHLLRVEHRGLAGDALDDDFGVLINHY